MLIKYLILLFITSFSYLLVAQDTLIDKRTGISIIFSAKGKIFPEGWYSEKINGKGKSLDTIEYERSIKVIEKSLLKYPTKVIQQNLTSIYILNYLEFFGQPFGGTTSSNRVYLSNKGRNKGYTDHYIEQLFHAEFSSILLRNHKANFDEDKWKRLNPTNFKYGSGGVNALKKGKSSEQFDDQLNKMGFINEYATSSLENDFNSFAKNIFLPKKGFDEVFETYENINKKRTLIIDFYHKIDSNFNDQFFNKLIYTTTY